MPLSKLVAHSRVSIPRHSHRGEARFAFPMIGALIAAGLGLGGCSTISSTACLAPDGPNEVSIDVAADANQNQAVAVDLVFITDERVAGIVADLTAREFVQRRRQLARDFPNSFELYSWELVPSQAVVQQEIDAPCAVEAALVFADYANPGDHRVRLVGNSQLHLNLQHSSFEAVES